MKGWEGEVSSGSETSVSAERASPSAAGVCPVSMQKSEEDRLQGEFSKREEQVKWVWQNTSF